MEWIKVEDRLPDLGSRVLVHVNYLGNKGIVIEKWDKNANHYYDHWGFTHWMPLPLPPKED